MAAWRKRNNIRFMGKIGIGEKGDWEIAIE
jgi:hypothetical protein